MVNIARLKIIWLILFCALGIFVISSGARAQNAVDSVKTALEYFKANLTDSNSRRESARLLEIIERQNSIGANELSLWLLEVKVLGLKQIDAVHQISLLQPLNSSMQNHYEQKRLYAVPAAIMLGNLKLEAYRFTEALQYFQLALLRARDDKGSYGGYEPEIWLNISNYYRKAGNYDSALILILRSDSLKKSMPPKSYSLFDSANMQNSLGQLYVYLNQYDKARTCYVGTLASLKDKADTANDLFYSIKSNLAALYDNSAMFDSAELLLRQVIGADTRFADTLSFAIDLGKLANHYQSVGLYDSAFVLYDEALGILTAGKKKNTHEFGILLNNQGTLFEDLGQDSATVLKNYLEALAVYKSVLPEGHPDILLTLGNLAQFYQHHNEIIKASAFYDSALATCTKAFGERSSSYAILLHNKAALYKQKKMYDSAFLYYSQAAEVLDNRPVLRETAEYTEDLDGMASIFQLKGDFDSALYMLDKSQAIRADIYGPKSIFYGHSLMAKAKLYFSKGDYAKAQTFAMQANMLEVGRVANNISVLSETEKRSLLHTETEFFNTLPSILYLSGKFDSSACEQIFNNILVLKGMLFGNQLAMQRILRTSRDSLGLRLFGECQFQKAALGKLLMLPKKNQPVNMDGIRSGVDGLERKLSRKTAVLRNASSSAFINADDIRRKIRKGQAAIEFIRFRLLQNGNGPKRDDTVYAALILKKGKPIEFIPLFKERELLELLNKNKNSPDILYPNIQALDSTKPYKNPLYNMVWGPIEEKFKNIHTIYISPTGALSRIAFNILVTGERDYLMNKYDLIEVLSTRSILLLPGDFAKPANAEVWGNINYDAVLNPGHYGSNVSKPIPKNTNDREEQGGEGLGHWPLLLKTQGQVDSISKILRANGVSVVEKTWNNATKQEFEAMKPPELLHIASHGFFYRIYSTHGNIFESKQDPLLRGGLVFAGANTGKVVNDTASILTAYELAQMDLHNTRLLVLSACRSGDGVVDDFEELIGLNRAAKLSGANQTISTLWETDEKSSTELMALFYKKLLKAYNVHKALYLAQKEMQRNLQSNPLLWGQFIELE